MSGRAWWRESVIYQIFVKSFQDSDGDGQGDLQGLMERLDYVRELGAGAVWLSPVYDSPWADFGYDSSNFERILPAYGTLEDFDSLLSEAHRRELRIILDWTPNHTSDRHPWFVRACSSRDDPHRDWYVWGNPAPAGGPPNNWRSVFGGSAWTYHEPTGQYYFHAFLPQQPDLNWRNRGVRQAMCENLRFWARRGVDGFRLDAVDLLLEDRRLRDDLPNPKYRPTDAPDNLLLQRRTRNHRGNHRITAMMRRALRPFKDCVLLGEMHLPLADVVSYYGTSSRPELHLPLNLRFVYANWEAEAVSNMLNDYFPLVPSEQWPCWSLGNHDASRLTSRIGERQARVAAMLSLTLRGTPTLYYGDEIGMRDVPIPVERSRDPQARAWPGHSRDVARTPMQWNASAGAGFTTGRPWLLIASDCALTNVDAQQRDPRSLLNLYRLLIALRRTEPALLHGDLRTLACRPPLVAYERRHEGRRLTIALNLNATPTEFSCDGGATILLNTALDRRSDKVQGSMILRGDEGAILVHP